MARTEQVSRSAHASLRGYLYQVYHSALCWANLKQGEHLCFEGDEDIDRFLLGRTENWQVKDYTRPLTFRSQAVQKPILGFLHQFLASKDAARKFVFVTTAPRGEQKTDQDLPIDVLEAWQDGEHGDAVSEAVSKLARRGVGKKGGFRLSDDQLRAMSEGNRWGEFVAAVTWQFEQPVGQRIRAQLQQRLGELRPAHRDRADLLTGHLVARVLELSAKKDHNERTVGVADFKKVIDKPIAQIESWYAGPEARRLREIASLDRLLRRGVEPPPPEPSPAQLLQAHYAVVPFYEPGRQAELAELLGWCDDETPVAVRLITGPGGTGKTRLLIEHGLRLEQRGWISGFIDADEGDESIQILERTNIPTLIVVDYAETRPDLTTRLLRASLEAARHGGAKLRVVFLARATFDWWESLGEGQEEYGIKELAAAARITPLEPLAHDSAPRQEVFTEAAGAFRTVRGGGLLGEHVLSQAAPSLAGENFEQALYLHMAALALVDEVWSPGEPLDAVKLLDVITDHELKFVREPISDFEGDVRDREDLTAFLGRLAAAIVLVGGVSRPRMEQLAEGFSSGDYPSPRKIGNRFRYVYPGEETWVVPVQPDLLGEHLVARFLDVLHLLRVVDGCEESEFETTLTVLTRLTRRTGDSKLLSGVLNERAALLALTACRLAPQVGDPLGMALAASLERARDFSLAGKLEDALLEDDLLGAVSLREVNASVRGLLLEGLEQEPRRDETSNSSERARLLSNLSVDLSDLGRREEALEACNEAVGHYRKLAEARPDAFLPDLAMSLNNLSNRLSNLGRREEALEACNEAVGHYRKLAEARPDAFLPDLARSLNNLS
ncbi:MAG: tetratricopeptide repeat protein, partial [Phycisphaerae bacterium]